MSKTTSQNPPKPLVYGIKRVAEILGVSARTIHRRIDNGEFPEPTVQFYTEMQCKQMSDKKDYNTHSYWTKDQILKCKEKVSKHRSSKAYKEMPK